MKKSLKLFLLKRKMDKLVKKANRSSGPEAQYLNLQYWNTHRRIIKLNKEI